MTHVLFWEEYNPDALSGTFVKEFMHKLPTMGKILIQFGSSSLLIIVYVYLNLISNLPFSSPFDIGLLVINVGLTLLSLFGIIRILLNKN
jgi:hypothetical protein